MFLCREKRNSYPSTSDRHNPLTFFLIHFFFLSLGSSRHLCRPPSPLEWKSSPSLVAAVFNALYCGTPPGSGRIGVKGAHHWWHTKTPRSSLNTLEIAVTDYPRTFPQDCSAAGIFGFRHPSQGRLSWIWACPSVRSQRPAGGRPEPRTQR